MVKLGLQNKSIVITLITFFISTSVKFDKNKSKEVAFKKNVYDFSLKYGAIDKSEFLNVHEQTYLFISHISLFFCAKL